MLTPSTRQGSWPTAPGIRSTASCSLPASRRRLPASSPRERWGYDVTGRGGVTLTEKWAGGMSTLHGLMSSGFPNLFMMPGRYEQSSVVVNFVYTLTENAKHLAYIASAVRERGARLFDVAQDAEGTLGPAHSRGLATGSGVPGGVHSGPKQQGGPARRHPATEPQLSGGTRQVV